jgi:pSer/pThr/pTyr-binding forkhead associated (FHA) protein
MRAQLVPIDGSPAIDIVKELTVVGRREECDLQIPHKSVSKMHCVIVRADGLLLLRDLGSTNGTRVNGQRVRRAALLPNDQLAVAGFKFRVSFGPEEGHKPGQDRTQQLDAEDVDRLLKKQTGTAAAENVKRSTYAVHPNPLPDVYPLEDSNN